MSNVCTHGVMCIFKHLSCFCSESFLNIVVFEMVTTAVFCVLCDSRPGCLVFNYSLVTAGQPFPRSSSALLFAFSASMRSTLKNVYP